MYGITEYHREVVTQKINKNLKFLSDFFDVEFFQAKAMSHSAFINPEKFYAEFQNRINSLHRYAYDDLGLVPVFFTVTAPSQFHNVKNFESFEDMVHSGLEYLGSVWSKFLRLKVFEHMKKAYGFRMPYYKIFEPQKSGVPHLHLVLYIPMKYVQIIRKISRRYFDGFTHWKAFFKRYGDGKHGILAYVSKYISKLVRSFDLDDSGVWYRFFSVRFFTTSRHLCPVYVHRKIKYRPEFFSYYDCTEYFKNGRFIWNFDKQMLRFDYGFVFYRPKPKKRDQFSGSMANSASWLSHKAALQNFGKPKEDKKEHISAYIGKEHVEIYPVIPFAKMSYFELYEAYKNLYTEYNPFVKFEMDRFLVCAKEVQKRGF